MMTTTSTPLPRSRMNDSVDHFRIENPNEEQFASLWVRESTRGLSHFICMHSATHPGANKCVCIKQLRCAFVSCTWHSFVVRSARLVLCFGAFFLLAVAWSTWQRWVSYNIIMIAINVTPASTLGADVRTGIVYKQSLCTDTFIVCLMHLLHWWAFLCFKFSAQTHAPAPEHANPAAHSEFCVNFALRHDDRSMVNSSQFTWIT